MFRASSLEKTLGEFDIILIGFFLYKADNSILSESLQQKQNISMKKNCISIL